MGKKIGIYNRWLRTLGGGERYTLGLAQALAQVHQVELISQHLVLPDTIKKRLNLEHVIPTVRTCLEHDIRPKTSFIVGFPDETESDMLDSFNMALDVLSMSPDAQVQMHLLAPLIGSLLCEKHEDELQFDGHSSDISLFMLADAELDMVRRYPEIFSSFYHIPTPQLDRDLTTLNHLP